MFTSVDTDCDLLVLLLEALPRDRDRQDAEIERGIDISDFRVLRELDLSLEEAEVALTANDLRVVVNVVGLRRLHNENRVLAAGDVHSLLRDARKLVLKDVLAGVRQHAASWLEELGKARGKGKALEHSNVTFRQIQWFRTCRCDS